MTVTAGFFLYAYLKDLIVARTQVNFTFMEAHTEVDYGNTLTLM